MIETTAKELLINQKKRFFQAKQKEQDNSITENAKANFRRKPYMGMYRRQDQCGNDLGRRQHDEL